MVGADRVRGKSIVTSRRNLAIRRILALKSISSRSDLDLFSNSLSIILFLISLPVEDTSSSSSLIRTSFADTPLYLYRRESLGVALPPSRYRYGGWLVQLNRFVRAGDRQINLQVGAGHPAKATG